MKKEKENPNHYLGKETGYELVNGVYSIAPLYLKQFETLLNQRQGIEEMLKMVTTHASKDLEIITEANHRVWERLANDIGLDSSKSYTYFRGEVREIQNKN